MAQLEVYNGPKVGENLSPANRQSAEGAGAVTQARQFQARQVEQVADVLGKAEDVVFKVNDLEAREQAKKGLAPYSAAVRALKTELAQYPLDLAQKGAEEVRKKRDEARRKAAEAVPDERARQYFEVKAEEYDAAFDADVEQHLVQQEHKSREVANLTLLETHTQEFLSATTPEHSELALQDVIGIARDHGQNFKGLEGEALDLYVASEASKAIAIKSITAAQAGDYPGALKTFEDYKARGLVENSEAMLRLENDLRKGDAAKRAEVLAAQMAQIGTNYASARARVAEDEKAFGKKGSVTNDAALSGVDKAFAQFEKDKRARVQSAMDGIWRQAARNGLQSISDAQIDHVANLDPQTGAQLRKSRDNALKNLAANGQEHAEVSDNTTYNDVLARISAQEVTREDQLWQFVPNLTKQEFAVLKRELSAEVKIDTKEIKESFYRATGKDPAAYDKEYKAFESWVTTTRDPNSPLNLKEKASLWAYRGERKGYVWDSDTTYGEQVMRGEPDQFRGQGFATFAPYYQKAAKTLKALKFDEEPMVFYARYGAEWEQWMRQIADVNDGALPADEHTLVAYALLRSSNMRPTLDLVRKAREEAIKFSEGVQ